MKKHLILKLISLALTISILLSCMTVLSYSYDSKKASTVSDETAEMPGAGSNIIVPPEDGVILGLNRTFDENFSYSESFPSMNTHSNKFEVVDDGDGNKYLRMTACIAEGEDSTTTGYVNFNFNAVSTELDTIVFQLDVIFDSSSGKYPGNFIRFGDSTTGVLRPLALKDYGYDFFDGKYVNKDYYSKNRHTLTYVVETEATASGYLKTVKTYVDNTDTPVTTVTTSSKYPRVSSTRIGFFGTPPEGCVIGIDNILAYFCDPTKISDPLNVDLGRSYGNNAAKVPYDEELVMKVSADSALSYGKKLTNVNAPVSVGGKAYLPVDVLAKHLGYSVSASGDTLTLTKSDASTVKLNVGSYNASIGSSTVSLGEKVANVDGEYAVIYYGDVEKLFSGYYGSYNDMGVVVVSPVKGYAKIATDMALVDVMKRFIFDSIDENKQQVNAVDFDTFTAATAKHPYLLASQSDFDYYKSIYDEGATENSNPTLYSYISALVKNAAATYNNYSKETGGICTSPTVVPVMPYDNNINNGYDGNLGMQSDTDTYAKRMQTLAFGYQITRDYNYARLAYYYAVALGEYEHWGPAHFLNCADTAGPYAIAYDWLYNAWLELGFDVDKVTQMLFTHAVLPGWYCVNEIPLPWGRRTNYQSSELLNASRFQNMTNNWNAVCTAGMTAASLASAGDLAAVDTPINVKKADLVKNTGSNASRYPYIFSYEHVPFNTLGDHTGYVSYSDYAYNLYSRIQYTLPLVGLDFYAPDGSYVESPSYWAYSANSLFAIGAYNDSVFGDEFGLITNCWGLDKTCYYALNAQSSDYSMWNYSDSSANLVPGAISTLSFPYVAYQRGDNKLAAIRKDMVDSGKYSVGYLDVFYYSDDTGDLELPELQYHMTGIDGYVARDSWEPGSTYVAIMGGYNESAHGQIDAGQFVYHNNGKIWFCDLGAEGYSVAGFGGVVSGNRYYKKNAEGNNTLALTTNPYSEGGTDSCFAGQYIYGTGHMYETGDNEHGAYALIDQTEVYYKSAISAKRGMLFTNDRKTVVIQDEVKFHEAETAYWIGHTYQQIYVSTDGKSAYMTDGTSTIRASLISPDDSLRFDILSAYEFILEDTHRPDYALNNGVGVPEDDRSAYKRLVVKCENVTSIDLAVVIEDVTGDATMDVGYTYVPMDSWTPTADGRPTDSEHTVDFDDNYYGYKENGDLDVFNTYFVNSNMFTVAANASTVAGDYVAVNFPAEAFSSATLSGDMLVLDADVFTDRNADGLNLAVFANGEQIASAPLSELVTLEGNWAHVTVVAAGNYVHFFKDGALVSYSVLNSVSFERMKLAVVASSSTDGTVSLDNLRTRRIDSSSTNLLTLLSSGSISDWSGYIDAARDKAAVFFYDDPSAEGGRVYGYTFSELSSLDYEGKTVELYYSNEHAPVNIDKACKIKHGEVGFKANSANLSAFISGGVTEFKNESITVYWHIGDTVETSKQVGITYAKYAGNNSNVGKITESVVDGKHIFNATGWSTTEGGSLATREDMLVTSENCHFYLVDDRVYYPYFYESTSGSLVARNDTANFFTDLVAGHKRIILNSDIEITAGGNNITKKIALYLNGYTLTFHETGEEHMFNIKSGNLSIYGGGGSIIMTGTSKFFFTTKYKEYSGIDTIIYVENATLEHGITFMDHRTGHAYFKNVTFNQTGDDTILASQNRTNGQKTDATMPKITLDGCTLNSFSAGESTFAVSIAKNSRLVVKGGTHINIPVGIALRLYNSYTTGGSTEAYVDFSKMSLSVEDAHFNASALYSVSVVVPIVKDGAVSYSSATTVSSTKIFNGSFKNTVSEETQVHVLNMASKLILGNLTRSTIDKIPEINVADGCALARQNDPSTPYVLTSDYATVTWIAGDKSVVEYWLNGSLPTADNAEVQANLALLNKNAESDKKYSYPIGIVDGYVTFEASRISSFDINLSLTLEPSMKLNIFIEQREGVEFRGFLFDGEAMDHTLVTHSDGKIYRVITVPGILPTAAAVKHELTVYVTNDNGDAIPQRFYFSVLDYLEKLLENDSVYGRKAHDLAANLLRYIDMAYRYSALTQSEDYKIVKALAAKYINKVTYSIVEKTDAPDLAEVDDAISSVQLILSGSPKYRFNLREGYTGALTLNYAIYGKEYTNTFNVVDGKHGKNGYIDFTPTVYDLRADVTIKTEGGSVVYNLGDYYNSIESTDSTLTALLNAIYAYSEKAEEYKNG